MQTTVGLSTEIICTGISLAPSQPQSGTWPWFVWKPPGSLVWTIHWPALYWEGHGCRVFTLKFSTEKTTGCCVFTVYPLPDRVNIDTTQFLWICCHPSKLWRWQIHGILGHHQWDPDSCHKYDMEGEEARSVETHYIVVILGSFTHLWPCWFDHINDCHQLLSQSK